MVRVDYERMADKPGYCRILIWEQADSGIVDPHLFTHAKFIPRLKFSARLRGPTDTER
jgi:hypothetical protein